MTKDHFRKPKTNDQRINELSQAINQIYQILQDINTRLIALIGQNFRQETWQSL